VTNKALLSAVLLLSLVACGKGPENPGRPDRPAPKTSVTLPMAQRSLPSADTAPEIMRLPAFPADNSGSATVPKKPTRIWI
jgi:hypothetical protein